MVRDPRGSESAAPRPASASHATVSETKVFPRRRESIPPVQFGMRSVLVTISAAAVLLAIGTTVGGPRAMELIIVLLASVFTVLMPVCFGALALYCVGMRRTFFLGAFVGCVLPYFGGLAIYSRGSYFGMGGHLFVAGATSLLSGYVAVVTRRYAERRGWHLPGDSADSASESPSSK
jgi:hypothetical protein